jgi:hypothetical protein
MAATPASAARLLAPLALLSPRIIAAIVDGTAPADLTITGLAKALTYSWAEQERRIQILRLASHPAEPKIRSRVGLAPIRPDIEAIVVDSVRQAIIDRDVRALESSRPGRWRCRCSAGNGQSCRKAGGGDRSLTPCARVPLSDGRVRIMNVARTQDCERACRRTAISRHCN